MESAFTVEAVRPAGGSRAGKYLAFYLARDEYAIQVLHVREIMRMQPITAVPLTPVEVKGVIHLRGKVIPVIDLRLKFGLPEKEYSRRTCVIVLQTKREMAPQIAILVDQLSEVLTLAETDVEDTAVSGYGVPTPYMLGIVRTKSKVRILLDIDEMLSAQDLGRLLEM